MAGRGRPTGSHKKYDLYEIKNGQEHFVETAASEVFEAKYGLTIYRIAQDIKKGVVKKGILGKKFRIYERGEGPGKDKSIKDARFAYMPKSVKRIKCSSGVRFEG